MSNSKDQLPWKPQSARYNRSEDDKHPFVIVHYWASWNPHDPIQDHFLDTIRDHAPQDVIFRSWDVDDGLDKNMCPKNQISNVPSLGRIEYGILKDVATGLQNKEQLISLINAWR